LFINRETKVKEETDERNKEKEREKTLDKR
jgi:hypothetical protein